MKGVVQQIEKLCRPESGEESESFFDFKVYNTTQQWRMLGSKRDSKVLGEPASRPLIVDKNNKYPWSEQTKRQGHHFVTVGLSDAILIKEPKRKENAVRQAEEEENDAPVIEDIFWQNFQRKYLQGVLPEELPAIIAKFVRNEKTNLTDTDSNWSYAVQHFLDSSIAVKGSDKVPITMKLYKHCLKTYGRKWEKHFFPPFLEYEDLSLRSWLRLRSIPIPTEGFIEAMKKLHDYNDVESANEYFDGIVKEFARHVIFYRGNATLQVWVCTYNHISCDSSWDLVNPLEFRKALDACTVKKTFEVQKIINSKRRLVNIKQTFDLFRAVQVSRWRITPYIIEEDFTNEQFHLIFDELGNERLVFNIALRRRYSNAQIIEMVHKNMTEEEISRAVKIIYQHHLFFDDERTKSNPNRLSYLDYYMAMMFYEGITKLMSSYKSIRKATISTAFLPHCMFHTRKWKICVYLTSLSKSIWPCLRQISGSAICKTGLHEYHHRPSDCNFRRSEKNG